MTVQPTRIFVKDQGEDAAAVDATTKLADQYNADPSSVLSDAIERNLNIVISKQPGLGVVNATQAQLQEVNSRVTFMELLPLNLFRGSRIFEPNLDQETEVAVFDELNLSGFNMKDAVVELMTTRTLNGTKYPNLKSVLLFLDLNDNEIKAEDFADLAPSLSMEWS